MAAQAKKITLFWTEAVNVGKPYPGSNDAVLGKCTCPVWSNRNGLGVTQQQIGVKGIDKNIRFYLIDDGCKVHGNGKK